MKKREFMRLVYESVGEDEEILGILITTNVVKEIALEGGYTVSDDDIITVMHRLEADPRDFQSAIECELDDVAFNHIDA